MDFSTTYDNTQELHEATGLVKFQKLLHGQGYRYYPGICRWCCALTTPLHKLQRCQGCRLVAYCDRKCQRNDWGNHKMLCKEFPAKDGKSILVVAQEKTISTTISNVPSEKEIESHTIFMYNLIERVKKLQGDPTVFMYPRKCPICCEARPNKLIDCVCCTTVYCSDAHRNRDKLHLEKCKNLHSNMQNRAILAKNDSLVKLPCILKEEIKIGSKPVDYKHLDNLRVKLVNQLIPKFQDCHLDYEEYKAIIEEFQNIIVNRLSFPLSIYHILQRLGVGDERKPLRQVTSLNIHVLADKPFVDSSVWEYFMHMIPKLKELHVTIVSHIYENSRWYMKDIKLKRCKECEKNDRIIKYTIYKNHYHMFFSSESYTTPDVIAVFGSHVPSKHGLTTSDKLHPELTWQNVTKNTKPLLIFTDQTEEALHRGIQNVEYACGSDYIMKKGKNAIFGASSIDEVIKTTNKLAEEARLLKKLLPIQENPLINSSINGSEFVSFSKYICCYQSQSALSAHSKGYEQLNKEWRKMEEIFGV